MHSRVGWMFCGGVMAGNPRLMFFKNAHLSLIVLQKQEVLASAYSFPWNGSHSAHNRLTSSLRDHTLELAFFLLFFSYPDWCICMLLGGSPPPQVGSFPLHPLASLLSHQQSVYSGTWLLKNNIYRVYNLAFIPATSAFRLHTRYKMGFQDLVESISPEMLLFVFEFIRNSLLALRPVREQVAWCFHLNWLWFRNDSIIWVEVTQLCQLLQWLHLSAVIGDCW